MRPVSCSLGPEFVRSKSYGGPDQVPGDLRFCSLATPLGPILGPKNERLRGVSQDSEIVHIRVVTLITGPLETWGWRDMHHHVLITSIFVAGIIALRAPKSCVPNFPHHSLRYRHKEKVDFVLMTNHDVITRADFDEEPGTNVTCFTF